MTHHSPLTSIAIRRMLNLLRLTKRSEVGLLIAIFGVVALTTFVDKQHVYWNDPKASVIDILRQTAMLGIFALGAAIVIISGGIDLSSGSVIAFSGTICRTGLVLLAPQGMNNDQPAG